MGTWARNSSWKYIKIGPEADDLPATPPSGKKTLDSTAEVDVAAYATAQVVDANLTAENIKKDVEVLGITGSYEGGGSSLADTVFPVQATVTMNVSGIQAPSVTALFSETVYDIVLIDGGNGSYDNRTNLALDLPNGETTIYVFSTESSGTYLDYNNSAWTVTVSGDAEVQHEDEAYWVLITGDCTINATLIGT